jgi:tetratricopeptide (TPR) repeat protein
MIATTSSPSASSTVTSVVNYDRAKSVSEQFELWDCAARSQLNRGIALRNLERYEQSVADCEEAEAKFATLGQQMGVAISRVNRGMALQNLGKYREAIANYEQAQSIIIDIRQWSDVTRYQLDMGIALQHHGQYEQAIARG